MRSYFRLLPLTITFAIVLLLVKVVQGVGDGQNVFSSLLIAPVVAQEEAESAKEDDEASEGSEDAEGEEADKEKAEGEEEGDLLSDFLNPTKKKLTEEDLVGNQLGGIRQNDRRFSPLELKILQQLSQRRKELDERETQLALKENLLTQTEKRVDEKFQEMKDLKIELAQVIAEYKEVEATKIQSLVKIYESMKPKDAARIFDELEMPVLVMVIDKMSEKKAAPILAKMSPKKAKDLTVELAEKRKMEDKRDRAERMADQ